MILVCHKTPLLPVIIAASHRQAVKLTPQLVMLSLSVKWKDLVSHLNLQNVKKIGIYKRAGSNLAYPELLFDATLQPKVSFRSNVVLLCVINTVLTFSFDKFDLLISIAAFHALPSQSHIT